VATGVPSIARLQPPAHSTAAVSSAAVVLRERAICFSSEVQFTDERADDGPEVAMVLFGYSALALI